MLFKTLSAAVFGIDAYPVEVEVDITAGQPLFLTVGLPDAAVRESSERIRSAIKNCGLEFPWQTITVNLAPADVKKEGSGFDLPIALGILGTTGALLKTDLKDILFLGELSLDGSLRPIKGALSIATMARQKGLRKLVLPQENAAEAAVVQDVQVFGLRSLPEALDLINETREFTPVHVNTAAMLAQASQYTVDFRDVKGQTPRQTRHRGGHRRRAQHPDDRPARRGQDHAGQTHSHHPAAAHFRRSDPDHQDSQRGGRAGRGCGTDGRPALSLASSHHFRCRSDWRRGHSAARGSQPGAQRRAVSR